MDTMEVYVLCCMLPLLAFAALMVQLYRNSHNKRTVIDQLQFHDDDFLYTMHGLITIDTQPMPKVQYSQAQEDGPTDREDGQECKAKSVNECKGKQQKQVRHEDSRVLSGCTAGISRINLINHKILKKNQQAVNVCPLLPFKKASKREGRECFQPTELPTIVEGLQY